MQDQKNTHTSWTMCPECQGRGKKRKKLRKKVRLDYQLELEAFLQTDGEGKIPGRPKGHQYNCQNCLGSGLLPSLEAPQPDTKHYPHVAIIGGGIGGMAFAVACLHRKIPFTLYEWDSSFNDRSQGYGLTLQQATKVLDGFGLLSLEAGVISTRHIVHTTDGTVIGEWGMRKWMDSETKKSPKYTNVHIARQSLRSALMGQLNDQSSIQWRHQLINFKDADEGIELNFEVNGEKKNYKADLVVGADGIRSAVRQILIGEKETPLQYLDCIVILGICSLEALKDSGQDLLDGATVFQTANGHERMYVMPFDSESVMWQLSFPMTEERAIALSAQGKKALKEEAVRRTQWHEPIPQIIAATLESQISGYPVYDRELLNSKLLETAGKATLIGDAAHPMSPFKGQGANQALLDALALARKISKGCGPFSTWKKDGLRACVLSEFESEMIERTAAKVNDSAAAAEFLHSEAVLTVSDKPRGGFQKITDS